MLLGTPRKQVATDAVAWVLEVEGTAHSYVADQITTGQSHALVARLGRVGVAAAKVGIVSRVRWNIGRACALAALILNQVGHIVLIQGQSEGAGAFGIVQPKVKVAAGLRQQISGTIGTEPLVKGGRAKGSSCCRFNAPIRTKLVAITQSAGGLRAEHAVYVMAQVHLYRVPAARPAIAQRQGVLHMAAVPGCGLAV